MTSFSRKSRLKFVELIRTWRTIYWRYRQPENILRVKISRKRTFFSFGSLFSGKSSMNICRAHVHLADSWRYLYYYVYVGYTTKRVILRDEISKKILYKIFFYSRDSFHENRTQIHWQSAKQGIRQAFLNRIFPKTKLHVRKRYPTFDYYFLM